MMVYDYVKIEPVYRFYLNNGFSHSIQEVANNVCTTKKTLFNRYLSKENLENCLIDYWQLQSCERIAQRMEYANNAVERLMMFLFELQYCRNKELHFFQKMKTFFLRNFKQTNPHFIAQLETLFEMGIEEKLFRFESEQKVYAYFFLFNAMFILLNDSIINTDYLPFLFQPILTESGKLVFQDIDIEQIFK